MKKRPFLCCFLLLAGCLFIHHAIAQNVQIQVSVLSDRKPVSPYIYGRNNSLSDDPGTPLSASQWQLYKDAGVNFFRENGGNDLSKYNWRLKLSSHPDWYNNVYPSDWDFAAQSLQQNILSAQGMWGFQLIGQAAKNNTNNFNDWAYNQSQWWTGTEQNLAGGGVVNTAGGSRALQNGDTSLYLEHWPADSTTGIMAHWFGPGGLGLDSTRIRYWNMDNEVEIWSSTHDDVMPVQPTAEAFMQLYFAVAKEARAKYPGIKLTGPVSPNEWQWYNWNNSTVTGSDGKQYPWMEYFIKRISEEQTRTGIRLLDVIDLHFYPSSSNAQDVVQFHRVFFDSTYAFPEANGVKVVNGGWDNSIQVEDIFGRCQGWLNQYMGAGNGVKFAVSETGVNLSNDPNSLAVWYASTMGEFMKHGVEYFSPWTWDVGMWEALHLYSRYNKGASVSATSSDETNVSAYVTASNNSDSVTVVLVNRSLGQTENVTVNFSDFVPANQAFSVLSLSGLPVGTETFVSQTQNALRASTLSPQSNSLQLSLAPMSITSVQLTGMLTTLPLSLLSFMGAKSGDAILLNFTTASGGQPVSRFDIERSPGGADFTRIGTVAAGNTAAIGNAAAIQNGSAADSTAASGGGVPASSDGTTLNYSFTDEQPLPSMNYYRLKITDPQGNASYSQTIAIQISNSGGSSFEIFPNPARNSVNVQWTLQPGVAVLRIVDAAGKTVKTIEWQAAGGILSTAVDIGDLPKGLYYVVAGGETRSFLKQ